MNKIDFAGVAAFLAFAICVVAMADCSARKTEARYKYQIERAKAK